ncbi:hypothetical protein FNV43_RR04899 [Rhamnella rubrinervis]|uniref:Mevalonate kinase n=1 Tax=Rhamnella rubrinervis TaxID=2594499 RepID=A0A8K0HKN1_9ROSA|nr:hypothetical protein FNV43_RR04899 [Rhamnella rubrinervis]
MEVKTRAPGKIILTGEHAVVHGSTAVAASIDLCTYVSLRFPTLLMPISLVGSVEILNGRFPLELSLYAYEEDVNITVHRILGIFDSFMRRNGQQSRTRTPEAKEEEFQALISDAARPFLASRTGRFVNKMELFLASGLNIEACDAVYKQRLGWSAPGVTSETTAQERSEHRPTVIPYLHIFDEDSDGTD